MQKTLVLIKPDAVAREVWLEIIRSYEHHGLAISKTAIFAPLSPRMTDLLYSEHVGKSYYGELFSFTTRGITIALCVEGPNAVARVRAINGATKPDEAGEGTIRKRYGFSGPANAVHGSANSAEAERELKIVFGTIPMTQNETLKRPVTKTDGLMSRDPLHTREWFL
jgi:nucleoside-diphosphate kinase